MVSGGVSRSARSPAVPTSRPRSSAAATTSAGGPVERRRRGGARARGPRRKRSRDLRLLFARTCASSSSSSTSTTAHAAAQATGLPPNVRGVVAGHERRRRVVRDEQRADRQPVREPLGERDGVGPDAELLEAKNVPVRPTPVCTSSRTSSAPCSSASARASASELRRERLDAALALHRLEQDRGRCPGRPPRERPRRSSVAKRTPGTSGSNASRFAGWPVTDSAPIVRPWNEPSSATMPGVPVALRAHLSAASIASAPELQKNALRAAEARRRAARRAPAIGSVQ